MNKKEAKRLYDVEYRKINREKRLEQIKNWRKLNSRKIKENYEKRKIVVPDYNKEKCKEYRKKNKEKCRESNKKWVENNKDRVKINQIRWRKNNNQKSREYKRKYSLKNRKKINAYRRKRRKIDPLHKITHNVRSLIRQAFRYNGIKKNTLSEKILGCSFQEFKKYLESKWEPWMNWENYGLYNGVVNYGWDIDHIIPLKTAINEDDVIKLNHYTNLQPLCGYKNRYVKM